MKYNFIEIGTANFYTCIESATDDTIGLSIEPISYYINQLPNKKNVIKGCYGISKNNIEEEDDVYYIPEKIIIDNNLPIWLGGCNAVGDFHKQHIWRNLEKYVVKEKIKLYPISYIFETYNITECEYFKLDTEGSDSFIIEHLINYLKTKPSSFYPKRINFETNVLSTEERVEYAKNLLLDLGYRIESYKYGNDDSMFVYL